VKKKVKKNSYEDNIKLLGGIIAKERRKKRLTQAQFATLCEIGVQSLIRVEKGENFTTSTLLAIQKGLRIGGAELTKGFWFNFKELD